MRWADVYAALWNILPGPIWVRILLVVVLVAVVLFCLVEWIFPWVNTLLPISDATVEQ
jgi:hypothetical protein